LPGPELPDAVGGDEVVTSIGRVVRFLAALGANARRPPVLRRCATIALVVGSLLSLVNQGDVIIGGRFDANLGIRIVANFLIPFVVSNLGAMSPPRS
jgi:hypothetical protein